MFPTHRTGVAASLKPIAATRAPRRSNGSAHCGVDPWDADLIAESAAVSPAAPLPPLGAHVVRRRRLQPAAA